LRTDRPTDRPRILENFERPYLGNGSSDPLRVWFYGRVFEVGGSNGAISGCTKSKMAAGRRLGKFQMAISPERDVRSTSCLILWWGCRGRRIEWTYFRLHQIQDGGWPPSWIISNGHISGTDHPIAFAFDPRVGFSATADRMDLLLVGPNLRRRLAAILENFE